jgi:hypothetical protein
VLLVACGSNREPPPQRDLAAYLSSLVAADEAARTREVASWRLDEAAWKRIVVDPYRALYADYSRAFDTAQPALVAQLRPGAIVVRRHYANDPLLTPGQARARWALPVMYGSQIATLEGAPIDAVFVSDGDHWRAIVGLDRVIQQRVDTLDRACGALLEFTTPPRCRDVQWELADAALRTDQARFAHACALAVSLCGKPSP